MLLFTTETHTRGCGVLAHPLKITIIIIVDIIATHIHYISVFPY